MHTILGSGGTVGVELAKELHAHTDKIRLVSRKPEKVNDSDELFAANLLNAEETLKAVEGSEVVFVVVGFEYNSKVWERDWPVFIDNVIEACSKSGAKLVFMDNIYMYDPSCIYSMTEETSVNPSSVKGKVRRDVAAKILQAAEDGRIKAIIARSADFYGPGIKKNSILNEMILKPLKDGKKAFWIGRAEFRHSFTYVPEAAKAMVLLANTDDAYNQVWHLPTSGHPLSAHTIIDMAANEMGVKPKYQVISKFMLKVMGLFNPLMKEMVEMAYQFEQDYIFDSSKYEKYFNYIPISYEDGIHNVIAADFS